MVLALNLEDGNRTNDVKTSGIKVWFNTMLLSQKTLEGLKTAGFLRPSPIQLHGIPLGKCGFDLLLEAKSGTGKTLVFAILALEKLNLELGLQTVILAPTREIACQICDVIKQIGVFYPGLCVEYVIGGLNIQDDINKFKKKRVHIVVGSPGRLKHLIKDEYIDVSHVRLIVLDEADKLIEKSFQPDVNFIFASLPDKKQVILSSATYSEEAKAFICKYVNNVHHICPDSTSILLGINQQVTCVKYNSNIIKQTQIKYLELINILSRHSFKQCLIFCNYQARVEELYKVLTKDEWPAQKLHGQQEQTDRLDALKTLQEFKCRILISTDLAARGIDASNIDLIINFETPFEWQTYLHRIGRAGRYGSYGTAITIISHGNEETKFKQILKSLSNTLHIIELNSGKKYDLNHSDDNNHSNKFDINLSEESNRLKYVQKDINEELWEDLNETQLQISNLNSFDELVKSFNDVKSSPSCNEVDNFSHLTENLSNIDLSNSFIECKELTQVADKPFESKKHTESNKNNDTVLSLSQSKLITNKSEIINSKENIDYNSNHVKKLFNSCHSDKNVMAYLGIPTEFGKKTKLKKYTKTIQQKEKEKDNLSHLSNTQLDYESQSLKLNYNQSCQSDTESYESCNQSMVSNKNNRKSVKTHGTKQYRDWYNMLKFRTRQIEMYYYISEMSKK